MSVSIITSQGEPPSRPRQIEEVGLSASVDGRESEFPLLARSLKNATPAYNTKVEWLVRTNKNPATWFNWTQIVRTPFGVTNAGMASNMYGGGNLWEDTKAKMLQKHLGDIETTIRDGRLFRRIDYYFDEESGEWYPVETRGMGGVKFFLRREPIEKDYISLRILRDCFFWDEGTPDFDGRQAEFISEISLQVQPANV